MNIYMIGCIDVCRMHLSMYIYLYIPTHIEMDRRLHPSALIVSHEQSLAHEIVLLGNDIAEGN